MAIRFNSTTAQLTRTTVLPQIRTHTLMAWLFPTVFPTPGALFSLGAASGGAFYSTGVGASSGNKVMVYNGSVDTYGTTLLTTNTWIHLAMTIAGTGAGQQVVYLNGVQELAATASASITANTLFVGNSAGLDDLNCRVAAIKIYDAVLTADEIKLELRQYLPLRTANLLSWHPMLLHTDTAQFGATWTAAGTLLTEAGPPIAYAVRVPLIQNLATVVTAPEVVPMRPIVQLQAVSSSVL